MPQKFNSVLTYWENAEIVKINKEPYHADFKTYPEKETALKAQDYELPYYYLLNGSWKFKWIPDSDSIPADFYKEDRLLSTLQELKALFTYG